MVITADIKENKIKMYLNIFIPCCMEGHQQSWNEAIKPLKRQSIVECRELG